jgi:ABC-2 type transport system ATP-binding protein
VDAVVVEDLRKSYGATRAVAGVSFTVRYGEIFSLLGPNGAGKTTVLEILEGYRQADEGRVVVAGLDPGDRRTGRQLREQIGLVLQELAVEPYLTVRESVSRNAGYYPNPRDVGEVIGLAGLTGKEKSKVKSLSGGQKRRLDLALGIIGNPRVLFLDEPTTGFDPSARRGAWEVIRGLSGLGTTILLTTHYMDEAQELADRVAVISGGEIIEEGTPATLGGRDLARARISFALPGGHSAAELPVRAAAGENGRLVVEADEPTELLHRLTGWALEHGTTLPGLTVDRPSLEDIYLGLTAAQDAARHPAARLGDVRRAGGALHHDQPHRRGADRGDGPAVRGADARPLGRHHRHAGHRRGRVLRAGSRGRQPHQQRGGRACSGAVHLLPARVHLRHLLPDHLPVPQ